jgi:EAL domain-containing protein (putative c-di-GMP-specific phosphodiesterase class I)
VESFEELAYLQAATRIQLAQGYYFARPMLLDDIAAPVGDTGRAAALSRLERPARAPGALRA